MPKERLLFYDEKVIDTNLDPEVEKIRDQIIAKIGDKPLDEVKQNNKKACGKYG